MRKVILDCDTGIDDALAILYGQRMGVDYLACTVTHGNVDVDQATRNTLTVLDAVGANHVPVYRGASRPLAQPLTTAEHVHGQDGLGNSKATPSPRHAQPQSAAAALVDLAGNHPGQITLVAVGPLTNVALAVMADDDFVANIANVVIMGGALGVAGNVTPVAEANIASDPEAAHIVFSQPWDLTVVGLEATQRTAITPEMIDTISTTSTPGGVLAWNAMDFYIGFYTQTLGRPTCVLHDPLAMALALDPDLATCRYTHAQVELRGEFTRGQVVGDLRPLTGYDSSHAHEPGVIRYVEDFDLAEFHRRFLTCFEA